MTKSEIILLITQLSQIYTHIIHHFKLQIYILFNNNRTNMK